MFTISITLSGRSAWLPRRSPLLRGGALINICVCFTGAPAGTSWRAELLMEFRGGWQRSSRQPSEPQRLGWVQPSPPYWLSISQEPTRSEAPCEPWRAETGRTKQQFSLQRAARRSFSAAESRNYAESRPVITEHVPPPAFCAVRGGGGSFAAPCLQALNGKLIRQPNAGTLLLPVTS